MKTASYLKNNFLDLKINEMYKFATGPFSNSIFKLIEFNKNKIKILLGSFETTLKKITIYSTQYKIKMKMFNCKCKLYKVRSYA